jgi:hypothetical protein
VKVEELYREIRALRIYEGATEVQKIVIARELLKKRPATSAVRDVIIRRRLPDWSPLSRRRQKARTTKQA